MDMNRGQGVIEALARGDLSAGSADAAKLLTAEFIYHFTMVEP